MFLWQAKETESQLFLGGIVEKEKEKKSDQEKGGARLRLLEVFQTGSRTHCCGKQHSSEAFKA